MKRQKVTVWSERQTIESVQAAGCKANESYKRGVGSVSKSNAIRGTLSLTLHDF